MTTVPFQIRSEDDGDQFFEPLEKAVCELLLRVTSRGQVEDSRFSIQEVETLNAEFRLVKQRFQAGEIDRGKATSLISGAVIRWTNQGE